MTFPIRDWIAAAEIGPAEFGVAGLGLGLLLLVFGIGASLAPRSPVLRRLEAQGGARRGDTADRGLLRPMAKDPRGLMKSLIPANEKERTLVQRQLVQAGLNGPHALRNYYLVRVVMGVVMPALLLGAIMLARSGLVVLPEGPAAWVNGLDRLKMMQLIAALIWAGFFGPAYWLRGRAGARRRKIEEAFPNALDLVQISVEAGLGLDAAMIRVGNELMAAAPEIAQEFLIAQHEIQAGRNREKALLDMAARFQVEEVHSFVNVVLQSVQFGTNIGEVLTSYAHDMRLHRELRAQEKANRLPVQMSAAMAFLMLPALLMLTVGPVVIRYVRYFAG